MKKAFLIAVMVIAYQQSSAQNIIVDTARTQGVAVMNNAQLDKNNEIRNIPGLVPEMIIILNYVKVIQPEELSKIKKSDIIKRYTIKNTTGSGEVASVLIVETRNKEKYK